MTGRRVDFTFVASAFIAPGRIDAVVGLGGIAVISAVGTALVCVVPELGAEAAVSSSTPVVGSVVSAGSSADWADAAGSDVAGWAAGAGSDLAGTVREGGCQACGGTNGRPDDAGLRTGWANAEVSVWSEVCWAEKTLSAMAVDAAVVIWKRSPSSPGLRTRIESDVLHHEHSSSTGAVGVLEGVSQSQRQFQTHACAAGPGDELVPTESSVQFQVQSQIHVDGSVSCQLGAGAEALSAGIDGVIAGEVEGVCAFGAVTGCWPEDA
jgi:hypothetical protein